MVRVRPPEPWEAGWKDTVIMYPGEVTRVKALFDMPGLYVWHCHILSHEDNEMMVPYCVGDAGCRLPGRAVLRPSPRSAELQTASRTDRSYRPPSGGLFSTLDQESRGRRVRRILLC